MKRQIIAVALGSLLALPALAMDRDVPYEDTATVPSVSASQRTGETVLTTIEEGRSLRY
ncbi:MAG: hypothetical protein WD775_15905 [Burkholderiales bacterium]